MPLIRCIEGHIFDNTLHTACPVCGASFTAPPPGPSTDTILPFDDQGQKTKPKPPYRLYGAAGLAVVVAVIGYTIFRPAPTPAPTPPVAPLLQTITNPPPPPAPKPAPTPTPAPAPAPAPTPPPPPAPATPPGEVSGPAMFTGSTGMLDISGNQIKLIGVIGNTTQMEPAAKFLHYATNGTNAVDCLLIPGGESYDCRTLATKVRISAALIANGFATADPDGPPEYQQWQSDAQAHHRGLWASAPHSKS